MKSAQSLLAIIATLLLHLGLVAAVVVGLSAGRNKPAEALPIAVELLPPPAAAEVSPPAPPPEEKRAPIKPAVKPKPLPKPGPTAAPKLAAAKTPPAPAPSAPDSRAAPESPAPAASAPPASPAPTAPTASTAPSAPPVKTGVSIPASYAASNRKPDYPTLSRRYEEQGTVVLRVLVKADGTAGAVEIKSSSGYRLLDESARNTVQSWRFNPAAEDGKPITEWYQISIPFKLQN
jgi:protein TonB